MKKTFLLGSTGSIGVSALNCIRYLNKNNKAPSYDVVGMSAGTNYKKFERQIKAFKPKTVYIQSEQGYLYLKNKFPKLKIFSGESGLREALNSLSYDLCINGLVGSVGMIPTLEAIRNKADVALANKETLIMAGDIVLKAAKKHKVKLLPVDSEHSAIHLLLRGIKPKEIEKLIITASGGPFFFKTAIGNPSVDEALKHPTWKMGPKITIDSATMMNKGLEIIEAHYLFDIPLAQIEPVIHPQSIIHSMVETVDGEMYAQIGHNDMRHPIQNAITYPEVLGNPLKKLKLWELEKLTFYKPDFKRFPLLKMAYHCGQRGGTALTTLNAANEGAVNLFLQGKIRYQDIHKMIKKEVATHPFKKNPNVDYILALDRDIKARLVGKSAR